MKRNKTKDDGVPDLVCDMNVSLMMNPHNGYRCIDIDGTYEDGEPLHIVLTEGLAKDLANLINEYLSN